MTNISFKNASWLLLSIAVIALDQFTKYLAVQHIDLNDSIIITSFFNFTLKYNMGAAFSFLGTANGWQRWFLSAIALLVSAGLIIWLVRLKPSEKWLACAIAIIIAGALSNLYDRVVLGYVIDFLHLHIQQWSWPVFNIADTAITIGAMMIVADILF